MQTRKLYYLLLVLLIFCAAVTAVFEARSVAPSGHFQRLLAQLQRQGSCVELPQFGVNTHRGRNPDDVNVRLIAEIGARIVRFDIPWIDLERQGKYDFRPYDDLINQLRHSGRSIILLLAYGHPDHSDGRAEDGFPLPPRTPEQRSAYGRYVQAVAQRYHGADIVYEIWNEPNLALFWPPAPDAKAYGELLAEATQAIRSVQPAATIIPAGLANENDPSEFLRTLAATGILDQLDGISFHPYRQDDPENGLHDISKFETAVAGRAALPLWITEWGYSESWLAKSGQTKQRQQAVLIAKIMLTAAVAKAKAALIYDLIDDGSDPNDQESSFGLYDYNFKAKQAADAFRMLASVMSDCNRYEFKIDVARNIITATFNTDSSVSYVIWTYAAGRPREICFAADGRPTTLKDVAGNPLPVETCGTASQVMLKISQAAGPVILQGESIPP